MIAAPVVAQVTNDEGVIVYEKEQCESFYKTAPIRDLLKQLPVVDENAFINAPAKDHRESRYSIEPDFVDLGIPENNDIDPALQVAQPFRKESWLKAQWTAQNGSFPPDPTGAAGPNYYIQAVNSTYRIYDKEGTPATSPATLGSLFGSSSDGDPIVMYDRFAERWFISQFKISSNSILIAVSETSDPLGSYYTYSWSFSNFPDYPKFAVWSHSYFMSANMSSQNCTAFEREKMLLGDPTAAAIKMTLPSHIQTFRSAGITYAEGPTEPDMDEPCYFMALQDNSWSGSIFNDHIKIFKAEVDWSGSGSGTVTEHQDLNTTAFNLNFSMSWDDIVQKGTSQKLDAIAAICSYKVQYRRFSGYNTIVMCHTVDVDGANRAAIRWYELRDEDDGNWSIYQQGTWSPDTQNSRWIGNICMDAQGNIGLAYSCAGPNVYAGLRYTGRFKDDPLGEMTVQEQIAKEGLGSQTGGNRYGDYSQMTMDPSDDMTFWFTGEWLGGGGSRKTEVFSFSSWHLVGQDEEEMKVPFFNAYQPNPGELTLNWRDIEDENPTVTLYDMSGKIIQQEVVSGGTNTATFNVPGNATGVYVLKMTGQNTDLSKKVYIAR